MYDCVLALAHVKMKVTLECKSVLQLAADVLSPVFKLISNDLYFTLNPEIYCNFPIMHTE